MTYQVGGRVDASDLNSFISTATNNVNRLWSTGSGDYGYGQTAISTVNVGEKVAAAPWSTLVDTVTKIASHQGTGITSRTNPVQGNIIGFFNNLSSDIDSITSNRLSFASRGSSGYKTATISAGGYSHSDNNWHDQSISLTYSFGSVNQARWFFNAGGVIQVSFEAGSTSSALDSQTRSLSNIMGTLRWGSNYTQQFGTSDSSSTTSVSLTAFHTGTSGGQQFYSNSQNSDSYSGADGHYQARAWVYGSWSNSSSTFTVSMTIGIRDGSAAVYDRRGNLVKAAGRQVVSDNLTVYLAYIQPESSSSTIPSANWGAPS
jgi:hypothetical protein